MSIRFRLGWLVIVPIALLLAACGSSGGEGSSETSSNSGSGVEAPAGAEGEFETDFSEHGVPYEEISSGGPPKDGIPAIDEPSFVGNGVADEWLAPEEPVILVESGGEARAYPLQVIMWHEIVNDRIDGKPVAVTFCPLCNTAIAFEGEPNGFFKIVADADTDLILSMHAIGPKVTDLISEGVFAKMVEGTPQEIGMAIHPHPALSEVVGESAMAVDGKAIHF